MGMFLAKREEEKAQYDQSRLRSAQVLETCRPEYVDDLGLLGLAPADEDGNDADDFLPDIDLEEEEEAEEDDEDGPKDDEEKGTQRIKKRAQEMIMKDKTALLKAAARGSWIFVQQLLGKQHVSVDHKDKFGRCALFLAAERGHAGIVDMLLQAHAHVESANKDNWTPLHAAVFHGQVKAMERLLKHGCNINARDKLGCTPLVFAASSPKLYLVDLVSKADRLKRKSVRQRNFQKQLQLDAQSGPKGVKGLMVGQSELRAVDPSTMFKYYPNRIELIVMEKLLAKRSVQLELGDYHKRTPLIYAARYGRNCAVSRLLAAKANVKATDKDGRTALFHAACNGHVEVVSMLIQVGAAINTTDGFFRTPLHGALESGDEGMCNLLLKAEASVNAYDCEGRTPIMLSMDLGNRRLFADLIKRRSNLDVLDRRGWNVVIYALESGMFSEVLPLLQKLGHRAQPIIRAKDPQGRNALHHAAMLPNAENANRVVAPLVALDYEAAAVGDCNGDTPVHVACELGRLESVRLMTERLPTAEIVNNRGETPLLYAAHGGHLACVVALLHDHGQGAMCDARAVDNRRKTLLMHACESGHLDLVNLLLQNREGKHTELAIPAFDVNATDVEGCTALMYAAREGHWQLLPSLVLAGSNISANDRDGFTALHWAAVEDEGLTVSCLLDLGLDINATDAKGWTSLMHAAFRGSDEAARLLVDMQADLRHRNWDGDTALQICLRRKDRGAKSTRDILTDGLVNGNTSTTQAVPSQGHFMISVISASDLSLEGTAGDINAYVCLQFCPQADVIPQVAFTSCALKNPSPEWHESFRFDTDSISPEAYLIAWVMAAPGDDGEEIIEAAALGVTDAELKKVKKEAEARGTDLKRLIRPEFTSALQTSFLREKRRADLAEEREVARLRTLATAGQLMLEPTEDLKPQDKRDSVPLEERRWQEVSNLRALLKKGGCDVPKPLAPKAHMPLGCVLVRFRHLRQAVWGCQPVRLSRMIRLASRGGLILEVDFRPKYFSAVDPAPVPQSDELFEIGPHDDMTAAEELAVLNATIRDIRGIGVPEEPQETEPTRTTRDADDDENRRLLGALGKQDTMNLYKRFMQVSIYAQRALRAQRNLGGTADLEQTMKKFGKSAKSQSVNSVGVMLQKQATRFQQGLKEANEMRKANADMMDKPFQDPFKKPLPQQKKKEVPGKKTAEVGPDTGAAEPWLEELLDGSRFV